MKKNDIGVIVVIALVCLGASFFIVGNLFFKDGKNEAQVKVVDVIDSSVQEPTEKVFHKDSINPAVRVFIGVKE